MISIVRIVSSTSIMNSHLKKKIVASMKLVLMSMKLRYLCTVKLVDPF